MSPLRLHHLLRVGLTGWAVVLAFCAVGTVAVWAFLGPIGTGLAQTPPVRVTGATATVSESNALMVQVVVHTEGPATVWVEYTAPGTERLRSGSQLSVDGTTQITLMRLLASTEYAYEVFAVAPGASNAAQPQWDGNFTTGPLPEAFQGRVHDAMGTATVPLTLRDFTHGDSSQGGAVILDAQGRVVWYYGYPTDGFITDSLSQTSSSGASRPWKQAPSGDYMAIVHQAGIIRITPAGELVAFYPSAADAHHDFVLLENGRIRYLAWVRRTVDLTTVGGEPETLMHASQIREIDPDTREDRVLWDFFDEMPPTEFTEAHTDFPDAPVGGAGPQNLPGNYLHPNALNVGPRGNTLVSLPTRGQIVSIAPDFSSIEWRLGGPDDEFGLADEERFWFEHAVSELMRDRILLFDNGRGRPRDEGEEPFSRALEFQLDRTPQQANVVADIRVAGLVAQIRSNVERLPNGHTFMGWSGLAGDAVAVAEVAPDGSLLWTLVQTTPPAPAGFYRAVPLWIVGAETEVETGTRQ